MTGREEQALADLLARIARGQEYPDASAAVAVQFRISTERLGELYDGA